MQAIDTERSPGLPSPSVTTRRRLMPHGTSCSFLHAVTQALQLMQRFESQRNFMRAMRGILVPRHCDRSDAISAATEAQGEGDGFASLAMTFPMLAGSGTGSPSAPASR